MTWLVDFLCIMSVLFACHFCTGQPESPLITLKSPSPTQSSLFPGNGEVLPSGPIKQTAAGAHATVTESPQVGGWILCVTYVCVNVCRMIQHSLLSHHAIQILRTPSKSSIASNSSGNAPSEYHTPPSGSPTPPIIKAPDSQQSGPGPAPSFVMPIAAAFIETVNVIFKGNQANSPPQ